TPAIGRVRRRMRLPLAVPPRRSRTRVSVGHVALDHPDRADRSDHRRSLLRAAVCLVRASAVGYHWPADDSHRRRHPILTWAVWRKEVPWMTLYFSIGVWTSLAM